MINYAIDYAKAPNMNVYERFVVEYYVSEFPSTATFEELLTMVKEEDDAIEVWEPFYGACGEDIVRAMQYMHDELMKTFMPKGTMQ